MEIQKYTVAHQTDEYPTGLKSASEVAEYVGAVSAERIEDLANAGYLPHYRVDGGNPLFKPVEVKRWLSKNLMARCEGRNLPDAIRVVVAAEEIRDKPPASICNLDCLQQVPKHGYQPGVYFLCSGDEVVYVGQSVTPAARISCHATSPDKKFDRVYLLPVPAYDLDNVEAAFISHLRPSQQGGIKSGRDPTKPRASKTPEEVFQSIGFLATQEQV